MLRMQKNVILLMVFMFILTMLTFGCEIKRTSGGQWHELPELSKPKVSPTTDMGGEFRRALTDLYEIDVPEDEPIKSVITIWDVAYFAGGMAKDKDQNTIIEIRVVADKPTNLYTFTPDREKVLDWLKDAHVVFKVGLGLDDWIDPLVAEAKTENPKLVEITLARNIDLVGNLWNPKPGETATITGYNPWFWMNPDNMMSLADTFYQVFVSLKPEKDEDMREGTGTLQHNYAIFPSQQNLLKGFQGKVLIQDVPVWPYYAQYFDIRLTATLLPDGVTEPTEERLQALAKKAKDDGVVAVINTQGYGGDIAERFAEMIGVPTVNLVPHPRMEGANMDDYFQQLMGNANRLTMKFREIGLEEIEVKMEAPPETPPMNIELSDEDKEALAEEAAKKMADQAEEEGTNSEEPEPETGE